MLSIYNEDINTLDEKGKIYMDQKKNNFIEFNIKLNYPTSFPNLYLLSGRTPLVRAGGNPLFVRNITLAGGDFGQSQCRGIIITMNY